mgnify:CR=1 FL=1
MSHTYTAVVDRIVEGQAVLLLEADGETVDQQELPADDLPDDGGHEGAVFEATVEDGTVTDLQYRPGTEAERREAAQDRFDRLSKRLGEE